MTTASRSSRRCGTMARRTLIGADVAGSRRCRMARAVPRRAGRRRRGRAARSCRAGARSPPTSAHPRGRAAGTRSRWWSCRTRPLTRCCRWSRGDAADCAAGAHVRRTRPRAAGGHARACCSWPRPTTATRWARRSRPGRRSPGALSPSRISRRPSTRGSSKRTGSPYASSTRSSARQSTRRRRSRSGMRLTGALAAALTAQPDRQVWHRVACATGPDECSGRRPRSRR